MGEIIIPVSFFIMVAYLVKTLSDNNLRRQIIKNGQITPEVRYLLNTPKTDNVPASLKWGLVLLALGVGASLGQLVPEEVREQFTLAFMLIGGGIALLIYYSVAIKISRKKDISEGEENIQP